MKTPYVPGRRLALTTGLLAGVGLLARTSATQARPPLHPHMETVILELREARLELEHAPHNFNGHRVEAIRAIDVAILQINRALECGR